MATTWPILDQTLTKNSSISGARVPGKDGTQRAVDFTMRQSLYPKVNPRKFQLEDINEMIDLMRAGKIEEGRMVVEFD